MAQISLDHFRGGAEGGTRTPTVLLPPAPQAGASANSATSAQGSPARLKPRLRSRSFRYFPPPFRAGVGAGGVMVGVAFGVALGVVVAVAVGAVAGVVGAVVA